MDALTEWKKINNYDYSVSNDGKIRNDKTGRIKKPEISKGYYIVGLHKNHKMKMFKVHRLIAQAFIPNPENKPCINHKNLIRDDNRIENLEWCTRLENNRHAIANGHPGNHFSKGHPYGCRFKNGERHAAKLSPKQVIEIRGLYSTGKYGYRKLGKMFNIHYTQIAHIVKKEQWVNVL